jgi:integrase
MGVVKPSLMKLSVFLEDSLIRTGSQIRESTRLDYEEAMTNFIKTIGDIDFCKVEHRHGERFIRECLDNGMAPATVAKKVRSIKRIFQLAVDRGQLDESPLARIKQPKTSKKKIRIYKDDECRRIIETAPDFTDVVRWDLLIMLALTTGMRKSELLNTTWNDIDLEEHTIDVQAKEDTRTTWQWLIKDSDHRTLPLTEDLVSLLVDFQALQPEGYPYILVPPFRYDHIQRLRKRGVWTFSNSRTKIINNFTRQFECILRKAGVKKGTFHDLRRTALRNWLCNGVSEYDVMTLAGHSKFETTHKFYLAVSDDLVGRARRASVKSMNTNWGKLGQACKNE